MEPDAGRPPPHSWKPSSQEAGNHSFSRAVESACMTQLSYMALTIYSTHGATGLTDTEHGTRTPIRRAKLDMVKAKRLAAEWEKEKLTYYD